MITCIGKLKDRPIIEGSEDSEPLSPQYTLAEVAAEAKETLGKGGNPGASIIEEFVGYTNCPTCNNYFRASFDPAYAAALQYIKDNGGAQTVELIAIEWDGQKMFQTGVDADGNPEWLGMISNVGVYHEASAEVEP